MKHFTIIAALMMLGACIPGASISTDNIDQDTALMSIDTTLDADQMSDDDDCNCPAIRCDGKTKAAACNVSCSAGQRAVCMCGKCEYGSFNRCSCN